MKEDRKRIDLEYSETTRKDEDDKMRARRVELKKFLQDTEIESYLQNLQHINHPNRLIMPGRHHFSKKTVSALPRLLFRPKREYKT